MNYEIHNHCSICLNKFKDPVSMGCLHYFCKSCIQKWMDTDNVNNNLTCPICRSDIIGIFHLGNDIFKKRYKTRKTTLGLRCVHVWHKLITLLNDICDNDIYDEKKQKINTMLKFIYKNKWILENIWETQTDLFIFNNFKTLLKDKIDCFASLEDWPEAKTWRYKFRDLLK